MRNPAYDEIKGWLIILVIIGHVVLGSIHSNPIRYIIYAVHMPLFIAVSGFLINTEKLRKQSWLNSATAYWYRVALPFIPAFLFFTGILIAHAYFEARLTPSLLVGYITTPYYHLWYIPTLVLWVIILIAILKWRIPLLPVIGASALLALAWAGLPLIEAESVWSFLVDKKVFFYFYFFLFGIACRRYFDTLRLFWVNWHCWIIVAIVVTVLIVCVNLSQPKNVLYAGSWFLLNSLLFISIIYIATVKGHEKAASQFSKLIASIGRNSLPIYLWHVAPLFIFKGLELHSRSPLLYYAASILCLIYVVWLVLRKENTSSRLDRFLYGV